MSHGCIHLTLSWNDRILNGVPKCHWGKQLRGTFRVLWKPCTLYSSDKMDMCLTILCQLVPWQMASITVHSCRVRWGPLFTMNNQNCRSMLSFSSSTMQNLTAIMMCKIWCNVRTGRCWDTSQTHCVDRQTESRLNPSFSFTSEEEWGDSLLLNRPFLTVQFTLSTADHLFTNRMNSEKRYFTWDTYPFCHVVVVWTKRHRNLR